MFGPALPEQFRDLQSWAQVWALRTEAKRHARRLESTIDELRAFYDAMMPRIDDILVYLSEFPLENLTPESDRLLLLTFATGRDCAGGGTVWTAGGAQRLRLAPPYPGRGTIAQWRCRQSDDKVFAPRCHVTLFFPWSEPDDVYALAIAVHQGFLVSHLLDVRIAFFIRAFKSFLDVAAVMPGAFGRSGIEGASGASSYPSVGIVLARAGRHLNTPEEMNRVLILGDLLRGKVRYAEPTLHLPVIGTAGGIAEASGQFTSNLFSAHFGGIFQE